MKHSFNKGLMEPVLSTGSRPVGKRANRVRSIIHEIQQSRLIDSEVGDGQGYLALHAEHLGGGMHMHTSPTDDDAIEHFDHGTLANSGQPGLLMPRPPPVPEPKLLGPHIVFRQINEQDQEECKVRRIIEKTDISIKSMAKASESEGVPSDVNGNYHTKKHVDSCTCGTCRNAALLNASIVQDQNEAGPYYKLVGSSTKLVMDVLESHGFKRLPGTTLPAGSKGGSVRGALAPKNGKEWSVLWSGKHLPSSFYRTIKSPHQRVNMFPSSFECTKKDALSNNLNRIAQVHGKRHFKFVTESYTLPREREELLEAMNNSPGAWIVKPAGSSQGRGIYIIEGAATSPCPSPQSARTNRKTVANVLKPLPVVELVKQLPNTQGAKDNFVVERYIDSPYLIDARKFDLRLYAAVTSFEPLKVYLHNEGLIRLASGEYSTESGTFNDRFSHLTNYSINKKRVNGGSGGGAGKDEDEGAAADGGDGDDHVGIKLKLSELASRMGISEDEEDTLWDTIEDLIVKTLISVESKICIAVRAQCPHPEACFEMFGFDVLIDSELNPWLMEVNFAPSLATDSPLDFEVKSSVLGDLFTLAGVRPGPLSGTDFKKKVNGTSGSALVSGKQRSGGNRGMGSTKKADVVAGGNIYRNAAVTALNTSMSSTPPGRQKSLSGSSNGSPLSASRQLVLSPGGGSKRGGGVLTSAEVREAAGVSDNGGLAPLSAKEKKVVASFQRECQRARRTGYRLIHPQHGPAAANYLSFIEDGKEAALMLCRYMFTLSSNPSVEEDDRDDEYDHDDESGALSGGDVLDQYQRHNCGGEHSPNTLKRITAEQIRAAQEEAIRQERSWRKIVSSVGKA